LVTQHGSWELWRISASSTLGCIPSPILRWQSPNKAEGLIKPTGRIYRQDYVLFLRAKGGKIAFLREYFDPVRAAKALGTPILGVES
jgi:hypothetical protein